MNNRASLKFPKLKLQASNDVRLHIETELIRRMREIWKRRRLHKTTLSQTYIEAITTFLEKTKVPKEIPVYERSHTRIQVPDSDQWKIEAISKIAKKREQPFAVILEEALSEFCDRPENYLGKTFYSEFKQRKEKL